MSKERELLQRILDTDPKFLGGRFIAEIQELLAQPEQTEHWKETLIEHFQSAFDSEMYRTDEGEELILLEDAICYVEEFSPPKREPLSDEEVYSIGNKYAFHAAVREIERIHGIGGGE